MTSYSRPAQVLWECYGMDNWHEFVDLDDRETLERVFAQHPASLPDLLDDWRIEMAQATSEMEVRDASERLGMARSQPPEGYSWVRWAAWFETRLVEAIENPATLLSRHQLPDPFRWQHRTSPALPPRLARHLALEVVDQHADRVDAWLTSERSTGRRLYLVADLGRHLGYVHDLADAPPLEPEPGDWIDPHAEPETIVVARRPTSRVAVRLARSDFDNEPSVLDIKGVHLAEPFEDPGDGDLRDRWPSLAALFGGWFSDREHWLPSARQYHMLRMEHDTFLRPALAEGREILTLADGDLRRAVRALGCYVEPPHLRLWLTWMFWRIETFWIPDYG